MFNPNARHVVGMLLGEQIEDFTSPSFETLFRLVHTTYRHER